MKMPGDSVLGVGEVRVFGGDIFRVGMPPGTLRVPFFVLNDV
jgi:hypothetical protein